MIKRLRQNNKKGFTLIELMIVIAIIGVLAAIAVPNFMSYRMRSYNTMATADCRTVIGAEAAIFQDGSTYGSSASGTLVDDGAVGNATGTVLHGGKADMIIPATQGATGTMLTGARVTGADTLSFAFPIGIGSDNQLKASVSQDGGATFHDSYVIVSEHARGNRGFGADSDVSNSIYYVQNDEWQSATSGEFRCGQEDLQAVISSNEFEGLAGDGAPNANFAILQ